MQLTNPPEPGKLPNIEKAIHFERLKRYLPAAGNDSKLAIAYYLWNCDLCGAFYIPLHFAEILTRNAIHNALVARFGQNWWDDAIFRKIMDPRFLSEMDKAVYEEKQLQGANFTNNHVVSAISFGFWEHLTTKRFQRTLWHRGLHHSFPGIGLKTLIELHDLIESVRRWRNRIAHHQAIFDKTPGKKHQEVINLIHLVCVDTSSWITSISRVQQTIDLRPT